MNKLERLIEGLYIYLDIMERHYGSFRSFVVRLVFLVGLLTIIDKLAFIFLSDEIARNLSFNLILIFWGWMIVEFARVVIKGEKNKRKKKSLAR